MKKLKFLITVPDKYTRQQYEAGQVYEFEDARAEEILKARTAVTKEPYAVEVIEVIQEVVETVENMQEPAEIGLENMQTEEKPKRKRKTKKDN